MARASQIVSTKTRKLLKAKGIFIVEAKTLANTTRKKYKIKNVNGDFNLLEYNIIVRRYLISKYNVTERQLDMCCFLYPKGVFTRADFKGWKIGYSGYSLRYMQKDGLLDVIAEGYKIRATVYELSRKGKSLAQKYHRYLLDIERLPADAAKKKFIRNKVGSKRRTMANLIDKLEGAS